MGISFFDMRNNFMKYEQLTESSEHFNMESRVANCKQLFK